MLFGKFATRYTYDPRRGQTLIADPLGGHHVVWQLDSGIFLRQHANGTEELSQFDWDGRCLVKVRFRRNEVLDNWSRVYGYSPVGALVRVNDSRRGTSAYQYDAAHRLIGAILPDGTQNTFIYDGAGNLLSGPGLEGVSHVQNRLLTANGHYFDYNERHHIVRESGGGKERQHHYDSLDRLVSCRIGSSEITFRYDSLGRRIEKTSPEGVTVFVWDGERLAAEIPPAGTLRVYVYTDGTALTPFLFIDYENIDAAPESGQRRYVFSDQIGCPICVESDAGEVVWRADIAAYGSARIAPNPRIELNLRWPGHYWDLGDRASLQPISLLQPGSGAISTVDPRDIEGGLNVYAYPARPLDCVDVDGLAPCPKKPMIRPDGVDKSTRRPNKRPTRLPKTCATPSRLPKCTRSTKLASPLQRWSWSKNGKYQVVVVRTAPRACCPGA